MSESNNHINYSSSDIEKYLKGALPPAEMHAMEKAALDDPFLADAMEGYQQQHAEKNNSAQHIQPAIEDLRQRLAKRVEDKDTAAPVIRFSWWKVAAIVFLFLGAGWFYLAVNSKEKAQSLAKTDEVKKEAAVASPAERSAPIAARADTIAARNSDLAVNDKKETPKSKANTAASSKPAASTAAPVTSTENDVAINDDKQPVTAPEKEEAKKESAKAASPERQSSAGRTEPGKNITADQQTAQEALAGKIAGLNTAQNTFNGVVLDQSNKPVANATVQIQNLNILTTTNNEGQFSFKAADTVLNVAVTSLGFESQNMRLSNNVASNQVTLTPNQNSLNEVVVVGYGTKRKKTLSNKIKDISINILDATPVIDWNAYTDYLEKNKKLPAEMKNVHGDVVVSFIVDSKNELQHFKIEKSLNDQADAEAIRLVKEGPSWKLLKGKKAKASVIVKF